MADPASIELLFLGSGTSAGVPMIGCHCPVCTSADPRDKRMRPSVVISYHGRRVLVDTTPELRLQCVAHGVDMIDAIVFTHSHADHVMGLDDVRRFNAISKAPLDVWADAATHEALTRCFGYAFKEPSPEVALFRPHLRRRHIEEHLAFEVAGRKWTPIRLMHGGMPVLGFRVGRLAYCTDVNQIADESFDKLRGLDVLVLDALHHLEHLAHFSIAQAIEVARRIGARQTFFTHMTHNVSHALVEPTLPEGIHLGYDGLRVTARADDHLS
jgi:phosphoribosyl 1,2-cyclic phosphate phosphodiesterase